MSLPLFPDVENETIDTEKFLTASQQIANLIDKCGRVFSPLNYDMQMNIDVSYQRNQFLRNTVVSQRTKILKKRFTVDKERCKTLQNLILSCSKDNKNAAVYSALLWLRRDLELILAFFENIVSLYNWNELTDNLINPLNSAYKESLEIYHNWITQQLYRLLFRMIPTRTQLFRILSNNSSEKNIIDDLIEFNIKLKLIITNLIKFYQELRLGNNFSSEISV